MTESSMNQRVSEAETIDDPTSHGQDGDRVEVAQPHHHFDHPADIVVDHDLSKDEKLRALDALEQDARQLALATAEGMDGGEDNRLKEVLEAKDALHLPPTDLAFAIVIQKLKSELPRTDGTEAHSVIIQAVEALEAANAAISHS